MVQKEKTKIQILKGLLVLDGTEYPKGSTAEVDLSVLEWLKGKKSHTLDFSVVKGDNPNITNVPTDKEPVDQGNPGSSDQDPDPQGAGSDEDQDGDQDQDQGGDGDQDQSGNSDQEVQTRLGLKSVDAALEARLAEAGLDSLEKLQGVSVGKLTTIKGVGKLRAEAIKAEVGAL
ncbi:MAG: hypothetical protein PHD35_10920 [Synergistaceae bacterium]|nr:hypothetical protein [Synergistaceae bacterium]